MPSTHSSLAPAVVLLGAAAAALAAEPAGRYLTTSGNLEVDIAPCGAAWCGTVARVLANRSMSQPGAPMPPGARAAEPGMTLLSGFVPEEGAGAATRWRGSIFNRENGKTYHALMSFDERGNLVLRAYVGLPIFGSTQVWTRLPGAGAAAASTEPPAAAAPVEASATK